MRLRLLLVLGLVWASTLVCCTFGTYSGARQSDGTLNQPCGLNQAQGQPCQPGLVCYQGFCKPPCDAGSPCEGGTSQPAPPDASGG